MTLRDEARASLVNYLSAVSMSVSDEVLDAIMLAYDEVEIRRQAAEHVRWEPWTGQAVNGVSAEQLGYNPEEGGYLIYVDERVAYLQMHAPDVEGLSPIEDITATAEAQVTKLVDQMAVDQMATMARAAVQDVLRAQSERDGTIVGDFVVVGPPAAPAATTGRQRRRNN